MRVHLALGGACNNHCLFCMEQDRASRAERARLWTQTQLREFLREHVGAEQLCFTSGEPTLEPHLLDLISYARTLGYGCITLMTNGRRLAYPSYAEALLRAGLHRVTISVHGNTATLHDGHTRTPGSFSQTALGIENAARLGAQGLALHTSTVVTGRNAPHLLSIYEWLRQLGVQQVVFNALQVVGGALQHARAIVPRYELVCEQFQKVLRESKDRGAQAFLVDVPRCLTRGMPELRRGYVEQQEHPELVEGRIEMVPRSRLDAQCRQYGACCEGCEERTRCAGVYRGYVEQFGWGEMARARGQAF